MKNFVCFLSIGCLLFLSGCFAGFSRLPEIDFIGKSREEVVRIFAENPEKAWGTHINICTSISKKNNYCGYNQYFLTVEETLSDKRVQKTAKMKGYYTKRLFSMPTARDFYEVTFDEHGYVVSQRTSYIQDAM